MEKNHDPNIVVLDKDIFERLIFYAEAGEDHIRGTGEDLARVLRHARKFNVDMAVRRRAGMEKALAERRKNIARAHELVNLFVGKTVYIPLNNCIGFPASSTTNNLYQEGVLIGPVTKFKNRKWEPQVSVKTKVRIRLLCDSRVKVIEVTASKVFTELPEQGKVFRGTR